MIRIFKDGIRWELEPDFEPLLGAVLAGEGRLVKESSAKRVALHHAGGRGFYVKRYRHSAVPFRPLKFFFKPSQAAGEWKLAGRLAQLEIPIVRHVALGERWSAGGLQESILVTEAFDGVPLNSVPGLDLSALLEFVHRMHERGVLQSDLHPENILVDEKTGELRLVDLHGTIVTSPISAAQRAENLACLRMFLPVPVSREIVALSIELKRKALARRSRRCWRENRDFASRTHGWLSWQIRLPFLDSNLERLLDGPDRFLEEGARLLKEGRSATVGARDGLVLKRHNLRKPWSPVLDLFRRSRAYRAFRKAYHLELAGIPTARPIAAADERRMGLPVRSYFVMQEIRGAVHLGDWRGDPLAAVQEVSTLVAKLHEAGFTHRDLKATNLVFDEAGKVHLIDLEGLEFAGATPLELAIADLSRLARGAAGLEGYSPRLELSFLRRYCAARHVPLRDALRLLGSDQRINPPFRNNAR